MKHLSDASRAAPGAETTNNGRRGKNVAALKLAIDSRDSSMECSPLDSARVTGEPSASDLP